MAGATFRIEVELAEDTYTPALEWIAGRMVDILPMYDALYDAFRRMSQRRFDAEGPGWAQLAPSTVDQRGSSHPILVADGKGRNAGQLRRSFTTKGAKGAVVEPMPDGVFFGSDDFLAAIHHHGTDRAGRDHSTVIPARPLVDPTEADAQGFGAIASEYFYGFKLSGSLGAGELYAPEMAGL